jgi:glycosyltransferase involved in cell wall biosynthesis
MSSMDSESATFDKNQTSIYISVIITAYNRRQFLFESMNSVLNQSLSKELYEIILCKNFEDPEIDQFAMTNNIKLVLTPNVCSMGEMLYLGISTARGNVLSFLDDDDIYQQNRLERVLEMFNKFVNLGYYKHQFRYIDENGVFLNRLTESKNAAVFKNSDIIYVKNSEKISKSSVYNGVVPDMNSTSMAIRKDILTRNVNLFLKINDKPDAVLFFFALISSKDLLFDSANLSLYRIHMKRTTKQIRGYPVDKTMLLLIDQLYKLNKQKFLFFFKQKMAVGRISTLVDLPDHHKREMIVAIVKLILAKRPVDPFSELWALKIGIIYLLDPKKSKLLKNH